MDSKAADAALVANAAVFGARTPDANVDATAFDTTVYNEQYKDQVAQQEKETGDGHAETPGFFEHSAKRYEYKGKTIPEGAVYQWVGEHGIIGDRDEELEKELFNNEYVARAGENIAAYGDATFDIHVKGPEPIHPALKFEDAGLHPAMMDNLKLCHYTAPMPVQSYVIPAVLLGFDVVGTAQTGSGKTAAYLIPIFSRIMGRVDELSAILREKKRKEMIKFIEDNPDHPQIDNLKMSLDGPKTAKPLVLVVCPTRELAIQIFWEARRFSYRTMLRPVCVYGGAPIGPQIQDLGNGCDILIATPGRLIDLLSKKFMTSSVLDLTELKFTVLDEADELLQSDWDTELEAICGGANASQDRDHTFLMFSATFPAAARRASREYLDAERAVAINIGRPGSTHKNIRQDVVWIDGSKKQEALGDLLTSLPPARTIVFVNSTRTAEIVDDFLFHKMELPSCFIHSGRTQYEREEAMRHFITGKSPILVATGVSARGIDVRSVLHVINYDLPAYEHGGIAEYVHRIGRTGRIGHQGRATSFYNDRDEQLGESLVKILLESNQAVPDFLEHLKPDDMSKIDFEDESDEDDAEEINAASGAADDAHNNEGDVPIPPTNGTSAFKLAPVVEEGKAHAADSVKAATVAMANMSW